MPDYRLLIFDWDGTLMDSEARIVGCLQKAATSVGLAVPEPSSCRNVIGLALTEACRQLRPEADEARLNAFVDAYRHYYLAEGGTPEQLFAGAATVLDQLAVTGYLLTVATGKSRRGLDWALNQAGMAGRFAASRCADECRGKPHPEMIRSLLAEFGASPAEALVIGDSEFDMLMAVNAGVNCLAVGYGVHEPVRLLRHRPVGLISDIRELPALLG